MRDFKKDCKFKSKQKWEQDYDNKEPQKKYKKKKTGNLSIGERLLRPFR